MLAPEKSAVWSPNNEERYQYSCCYLCISFLIIVDVIQEPRFDRMLNVMRLQKRGTAGEHTDVVDNTYDISNAERLGKSEVA